MDRGLSDYFNSSYTDISPFNPSAAIYFMDGWSESTIILHESGEVLRWEFHDKNTSIGATAPFLYNNRTARGGKYLPVPAPLEPISFLPENTPARYLQDRNMHLMQVISMNMTAIDGKSRLLIGLPYAEKYPQLFFDQKLFIDHPMKSASSYGVVQSLTNYTHPETEDRSQNGYPARSFFGIYHILETEVGTFFNKTPTQMELQPADNGKLARNLPPIPFRYEMINSPVALYDVNEPSGPPVAHVVSAKHHDAGQASMQTDVAWPFHRPDLTKLKSKE